MVINSTELFAIIIVIRIYDNYTFRIFVVSFSMLIKANACFLAFVVRQTVAKNEETFRRYT